MSDYLFFERVYSEAMLQGRTKYILIDDFDKNTAYKFLDKYSFSDKEKNLAWKYVAGKPGLLKELIKAKMLGKEVEELAKELLSNRKGEIKRTLRKLKELEIKFEYEGDIHKIKYGDVINALIPFKDKESVDEDSIHEVIKAFLVKKNILFDDPLNEIIKPQSRLDLLAIREILKDIGFIQP